MTTSQATLDELNSFDQERFVAALADLFEGPPWVVARVWQARPFTSLSALHATCIAVIDAASPEERVALLRAHPDLVGRAALAGALGASSTLEQAAAGLDHLSPEEIAAFTRLNATYQERFGFPFVICARKNKKDSILAGFERRMGATREDEITTALGEVGKIAWLRLCDQACDE